MTRLALALAGMVAASTAAAADPLPVVERAGDANLEPQGPRTGLSMTLGLVFTNIIAIDSSGDVGRGPGLTLRLGMAANPDTIITLELTGASMLHERTSDMKSTLYTNDNANLLLGAQYYAKPSLWLRGSIGAGRYVRRGQFDSVGMELPDTTHYGPAALFGVGLDLLRRKSFLLGLDAFASFVVDPTGIVTGSGLGLDVGFQ